jgi:beta-mannosidase
MSKVLLCVALTVFYNCAIGQSRYTLTEGWLFRKAHSNDAWLRATVPGTVIANLEAAGELANPFLGCSSDEIQWINNSEWEYKLTFDIPNYIEPNRGLDLVFEGLDTYANVFLNGKPILTSNNMFRRWTVDIANIVKPEGNELRVVFYPITQLIEQEKAKVGIELPGGEWAYARKAAFQFGWDFAPRMLNCGIWQPVYIQTKYETKLNYGSFVTKTANLREATLIAEFSVTSAKPTLAKIRVVNTTDWQTLHEESVEIKEGLNQYSTNLTIKNPLLWWPNGMGKQNLYTLALILETDAEPQQVVTQKLGIRKVELINEKDNNGTSFYFKVNGKPLFAKGANVVPPHSYKFYEIGPWKTLAEEARLSNMNMLRVWGGGIYPPNAFFDACDSLGILVWQDFMFACTMYPWDEGFTTNVRKEVEQQIVRLKGHPSLALWCGNNEVDEGWRNWGWAKQFANDSLVGKKVWFGYQRIFHELIAETVQQFDPTRPYWPSSPLHGWGSTESLKHGDAHYWGVWWGKEPFEAYKTKIPRFMSEYGIQSYPTLPTIKLFADGKNMPDSAQLKCHQKHPTGFQSISKYLEYEGFSPKNLEQTVYFSQITQAIGYQVAIEAHRLASPYCMGSLYWQMNDCWPAISWSGIDFVGNWKAMQYFVKRSYAPIVVVPEFVKNRLVVTIKSDLPFPVDGELIVTLYTLDGKRMGVWKDYHSSIENEPKQIFNMELTDGEKVELQLIASVEFITDILSSYTNCSVNDRCSNIELSSDPKIKLKKKIVNGETLIILEAKKPAFFVELYNANGNLRLDDNFIHLIPGKKYTIRVIEGDLNGIGVKSMWDYLNGR